MRDSVIVILAKPLTGETILTLLKKTAERLGVKLVEEVQNRTISFTEDKKSQHVSRSVIVRISSGARLIIATSKQPPIEYSGADRRGFAIHSDRNYQSICLTYYHSLTFLVYHKLNSLSTYDFAKPLMDESLKGSELQTSPPEFVPF